MAESIRFNPLTSKIVKAEIYIKSKIQSDLTTTNFPKSQEDTTSLLVSIVADHVIDVIPDEKLSM